MKSLKKLDLILYLSILLLCLGEVAVIGIALFSTNATLKAQGRMKKIGVEVYADAGGTQIINSIFWGDLLEPGDVVVYPVYIENTGRASITLALFDGNWLPPEAEPYMTLTWNYDGSVIGKGEIIPVNMTLTISPDITDVDVFTFDIVIEGTG